MTMPERWRRTFLAYAEEPEHRRRIAEARAVIARLRGEVIAVPFSGGKDSTVLLHLAATSGIPFVVAHFDFGRPDQKRHNAFPAELEADILRNGAMIAGKPVTVITKRKYWRDSAAMHADRAGARVVTIADTASWIVGSIGMARSLGATVNAVGLRSEESGRRKRRIAAGDQIAANILPEVWPIASLTWRDVWAYLVLHDVPYPALYDERAGLMGSYEDVRLTSLFRDPTEARADSAAMDGVLSWRLRGR